MKYILTSLVLSFTLAACGGTSKRSSELLYDVRGYNAGVRWNKLPQAASRIHPDEREAFFDEREELEDELRIDEFEIKRLKMEGKDKQRANVRIQWTWHLDSQGIVHTTTTGQDWKRFGKNWIMLDERYVRGDEMPGVRIAAVEEEDEVPEGLGEVEEEEDNAVNTPEASE